MTGIYIITNLVNSKAYIGKSRYIESRFEQHKKGYKSNVYLQNSIKKHGIENFKFEILEECSKENLDEREKYWISYYEAVESEMFFNIARGGNGGDTISGLSRERKESYIRKLSKPRPEKFRLEQSLRFSGVNNPRYGVLFSEEWKRTRSNKYKGIGNPFYGKVHSKETRSKISDSHKDKIWINNGEICKQPNKNDLDKYLADGWIVGRLYRRRSGATTIEITSEKKDLR